MHFLKRRVYFSSQYIYNNEHLTKVITYNKIDLFSILISDKRYMKFQRYCANMETTQKIDPDSLETRLRHTNVTTSDDVHIRRPHYTQIEFDEIHLLTEEKQKLSTSQRIRNKCSCSGKCLLKSISTFVPITRVLRFYNIRHDLISDILVGITIGVMHIPQALAFGLLTSVKVENGLYTSIWPIIIYVIFGTSPHVSMGTSAVICIMTASVVDRRAEQFSLANPHLLDELKLTNSSKTFIWDDVPEFMDYKENIAINIALFSGLIMLLMGFLRLGFITAYLSESFFSAFTSGAAVHIATSQVPALLGVNVPRHGGIFKIIYTYTDIISAVASTAWVTPVVGLCSIVVLLLVKIFVNENEKIKHKLPIPIPIELLVVIVATVVSYFIGLSDKTDVVGILSSEIPAPVMPDFDGIGDYIVDCVVMALLIFANTIAMAKICAKKHNYEVNDCQELIAYGLCNFLSAFMKCFPSAVAPPRSMVCSSMNAKTTLSGVLAAVLMLMVVLVMSSLFQTLPKAALAAIIVVALKGLFIQMGDCRKFWRINKIDFIIWLSTIFSVVFLDIDIGLGVGVVVSLITVVFQTQFARGYRLAITTKDDFVVEKKKYSDSNEPRGVKIFRFQSNIYFANAEIFRNTLYRTTLNPRKILRLWKKYQKTLSKDEANPKKGIPFSPGQVFSNGKHGIEPNDNKTFTSVEFVSAKLINNENDISDLQTLGINPVFTVTNEMNGSNGPKFVPLQKRSASELATEDSDTETEGNVTVTSKKMGDMTEDMAVSKKSIQHIRRTHHIILDFSSVNYLDASGANVLSHVFKEYDHVNIKVFFARVSSDVHSTMEHAGVFNIIPREFLFLDVHDAIAVAEKQRVLKLSKHLANFSEDEAAEDSYVIKI